MQFEPNGSNEVLEGDDFHISYNPSVGNEIWPGVQISNICAAILGLPNEGPETALVIEGKFYILKGDWRSQYAAIAVSGKKACLDFYIRHMHAHNSPWSDPLPHPSLNS